jgi:nuclear GTP-binding protein
VWQYITMTKRIYLIDCPGVVPPSPNDTDTDILLRGVVRVENVESPEQYIPAVLAKCKLHHIQRTYDMKDWEDGDPTTFLELLARKGGRLLKGGEPDLGSVAKMVLNDFLRGKIPWFTPLPTAEGGQEKSEEKGVEARAGRLGEMGRKRKREPEEDGEEEKGGDGVDADDGDGESADAETDDDVDELTTSTAHELSALDGSTPDVDADDGESDEGSEEGSGQDFQGFDDDAESEPESDGGVAVNTP